MHETQTPELEVERWCIKLIATNEDLVYVRYGHRWDFYPRYYAGIAGREGAFWHPEPEEARTMSHGQADVVLRQLRRHYENEGQLLCVVPHDGEVRRAVAVREMNQRERQKNAAKQRIVIQRPSFSWSRRSNYVYASDLTELKKVLREHGIERCMPGIWNSERDEWSHARRSTLAVDDLTEQDWAWLLEPETARRERRLEPWTDCGPEL